ncbi:MAG: SlyX family protein [Xanthomonadales bacterium]|nr:SlyX family protein [Xanthomonadales bacterium]
MADRHLIEIETRITYQEAAVQELSDIVSRQQLEIDRLSRLCRDLASQLAGQADPAGGASPAEHEVPPHY